MIQNELPTFRRWGKKLLEWKRAISIALLVLAVHHLGTYYLKRYYAVIEPCDQPCQDAISCDPLELTFEVAPAEIKLGQPYYLWYRARLKNRSCRELSPISVDGLLDSSELRKLASTFWVTVIGPDGREVERLPPPRADGGIAWDYGNEHGLDVSSTGTIHPYQPNFERIKQLRESKKLMDSGYVDLRPGESFETLTPVLRPYRIVATSVTSDDGSIGDGYRWLPVKNPPEFPKPPEGFNVLDRYTLTRPGRYMIHAGYNRSISVYPIFARWENRWRFLDFLFWPTHPSTLDSMSREVSITALPARLQVSK